jgi:hypothetical protein
MSRIRHCGKTSPQDGRIKLRLAKGRRWISGSHGTYPLRGEGGLRLLDKGSLQLDMAKPVSRILLADLQYAIHRRRDDPGDQSHRKWKDDDPLLRLSKLNKSRKTS